MPGTLHRPDARAGRELISEPNGLGVPTYARPHRPLRDHTAARRGNDRERVSVAMRVDTHHVVQLVCKHPTDPPTRRVRWTPV